jgi:tetratricopeptide (TPR) repeat protein
MLLLCAASAHSDPATKAHALNAKGKKHLKAKDYVAALDAFEEAYDIYPSAGLLVNIGTTYQQMGKTVEAANWYQRYLDDPGAQEPLATQTAKSLAVLDINLGRLAIAVDERAEIQIGDEAWTPARRLVRVQPGTFVVRAREGDRVAEQSGRIDAGEEIRVELELSRHAEVDVVPDDVPITVANTEVVLDAPPVIVESTPRPANRRRHYAYAAGGAGVVALGASVLLALRANDEYARAEDLCNGDPRCPGEGRHEAEGLAADGRRDRWVAIGLAVVGSAAVATGAVLWIKQRDGESSAALTFVAGPDAIGLAAAGTF